MNRKQKKTTSVMYTGTEKNTHSW